MKTYYVTFKTNNPKMNDGFLTKAYAKSKKDIKEQAGGRMSPFYGYHIVDIRISSCDYDYSSFKVIPGFEKTSETNMILKPYKAYVAANKETNAFDSIMGKTAKSAIASAKRKYGKNAKDLHFWVVCVHENGQEEKM